MGMKEISSAVRPQVEKLLSIQDKQNTLQAEFEKKVLDLELEYEAKYSPLYTDRVAIIKGTTEDSEGIPEFWLTALKNNCMLGEIITEADEPALASLLNISCIRLEDDYSFKLEFEFGKNSFFTNPILTKTFYYAKEEVDSRQTDNTKVDCAPYRFDRVGGTEIDWVPGSNLTVKMVKKTQRHKTKNITRVVEREEKIDSFFNFFDTFSSYVCSVHEHDDEDDNCECQPNEVEYQFEIGDYIRNKIIPNAVNWYLGIATDETIPIDYEGLSDYEEEVEDDDESHYEDEGEEKIKSSGRNRPTDQDCKQQ